jgi:acyl-CoA synthetase
MASLAEVIDGHAAQKPDAPAFLGVQARMSWAAYAERSRRLACALAGLELTPGARVGVLLPDGPGVHAAYVGVERAGATVMGIGPRAGLKEIRHLLKLSGASVLVSRGQYRETDMRELFEDLRGEGLPLAHQLIVEGELAAEDELLVNGEPFQAPGEAAQRELLAGRCLGEKDLFLLNSTSGTTGMPKCVKHDQARWFYFHQLATDAGEFRDDDVFMSVLPAPFGFGIWTAHVTPTLLGCPTVLMPSFSAEEAIALIEQHRVSVLAAVSTQFIMMLNSDALRRHDMSSLRALFTGGEAVPARRAAEFEELTGAKVLQFYGSNETGALSRTTTRDSQQVRFETAGKIIEDMQVKLVDEAGNDITATGHGQPACRGPAMSGGYYGDEAATRALYTQDGWMLTGDIGTLDAEGHLTIIGRVADFIIRGGKNISGPAVEESVASHPAVAMAAAVGMPDEVFGERVCVYVELQDGATLNLEELKAHLVANDVSKESFPERLEIVDALPRSSGGKVAKKQLRDDIAALIEAEKEDPS